MTQQSNEELLSQVEKSVNQKFKFRDDVLWLLEISQHSNMKEVFEDILFFSKFISRAMTVLQREGISSESTVNLQNEFKSNLEKTHTLLRILIKETDELRKQNFVSRFLSMTPDCMDNLLAFTRELTWMKNYTLDQAK